MPLESADSTSATRCFLEALTCAAVLGTLLVGGVAAVRSCVDLVQVLAHLEFVMPG